MSEGYEVPLGYRGDRLHTSKGDALLSAVFRCAIFAVALGAAASLLLLLLLLSTVMCSCTVMISLVVVISRDFESYS